MAARFVRQRYMTGGRAVFARSAPADRRWFTAIAAVTVGAVSACGTPTTPPASTGVSTARPAPSSNAVPTRQVGNCLDGTSSSASYYAPRLQAMLAEAVAAWASPPVG